jgi:hypothetical protein
VGPEEEEEAAERGRGCSGVRWKMVPATRANPVSEMEEAAATSALSHVRAVWRLLPKFSASDGILLPARAAQAAGESRSSREGGWRRPGSLPSSIFMHQRGREKEERRARQRRR